MSTQTLAPTPEPLVRMNLETLRYEPTGYVIHRHAPDRVFIGEKAGDEPALLLRLPHPEVLTEVAPRAWAYDPPLSEKQQACLARLVDAALGARS